MCSTFKLLLVAAVLYRVDDAREHFSRSIHYRRADLLDYSPVTTTHVARGSLTVAELCRAALVFSDNTAANLLLRTVGGPAAVTAFLRTSPLADPTTRLDRTEPTLNSAIPGDPRDTTTPSRMAHDVASLLVDRTVLSKTSSLRLERWMRTFETGLSALRAGMPSEWTVGDKTGSGDHGTHNDVAIARRHDSCRIVTAYLTEAEWLDSTQCNAALAAVSRVVYAALSAGNA